MNTEEISEQDADFIAEKIGEHFQMFRSRF